MTELPQPREISAALLADTVEQIEKDLNLDPLKVDFDQIAPPYEQIFNALLPEIRDILIRDAEFLPQLLYQIDIKEHIANEAVNSNNPSRNLTDLIIRRCFQKVVFRKLYKP